MIGAVFQLARRQLSYAQCDRPGFALAQNMPGGGLGEMTANGDDGFGMLRELQVIHPLTLERAALEEPADAEVSRSLGMFAASVRDRAGAMQRLLDLVRRVAASDINVLILGETGAGKERLAEDLHRQSPRGQGPLLRLNCAAFAEPLLESELFGHERGAFTGAEQAKPGLLEAAQGGTVLLDEVGEIPLTLQAKLLRVLEEHQVLRVGSLKPRQIDVRFVAATNRDLGAEVTRGRFRADLFYRLNGITLFIPPLRERTTEIEPLAREFATQACRRLERRAPEFSAEALAQLRSYSWPGNIRELKNAVEHAVLLCGEGPVRADHLPSWPARTAAATTGENANGNRPPLSWRPLLECDRILAALDSCHGNQTRAAKLLRIARSTLIKHLEYYAIPRPQKG